MYEDVESSRVQGDQYCIADELIASSVVGSQRLHNCGSSDAMSTYLSEHPDGTNTFSGYCFSCNQAFNKELFAQSSHATDFGIEGGIVTGNKTFKKLPKRLPITKEETREILSYGYDGKNTRGLKSEYCQLFGHITKLDDNGNPIARFYPETKDGRLVGYKSRTFPKSFGYLNKGVTGIGSDLSGQVKFKDFVGHRDVMIVGGCEDKVAAFQIFRDNQIRKGQEDYAPMAVVSPTTGESSAIKQIRNNYDFLNQFQTIYLAMDNDDAGKEAMEAIAAILPREKVKVVYWTHKDPNNHVILGKEKQALSDFWNATSLVESGVLRSTELMSQVSDVLLAPRIPLPDYMRQLSDMAGGKFRQFTITNLIGFTSAGKSTHINAMVYHWIFHAPEKPCVISLEASAGQYALDLLSLHLEKNLIRMGDGQEVMDYLNTPECKELWKDLWEDEFGEPRFALVDDRCSDIKGIEQTMEDCFNRDGCRIFVIDVLSDLLRGASSDLQEDHMMWQRNFVKKGATIFNVLHTSKPPTTKDGKQGRITEYMALGSGTFVQSSACNILIERDKLTDDPIEKNTTRVSVPKLRGGDTGKAGEWYYDVDTRKVYDRNVYFAENPDKLPVGYDLNTNPLEVVEEKKCSGGFGKKQKSVAPPHPLDNMMDDGSNGRF